MIYPAELQLLLMCPHIGRLGSSYGPFKLLSKRISIIRALVNQPSIIFADEPTSALDDNSCNNVVDLLTNLSRENNTTLVIVTHDKRIKDKFPNQINLNDF